MFESFHTLTLFSVMSNFTRVDKLFDFWNFLCPVKINFMDCLRLVLPWIHGCWYRKKRECYQYERLFVECPFSLMQILQWPWENKTRILMEINVYSKNTEKSNCHAKMDIKSLRFITLSNSLVNIFGKRIGKTSSTVVYLTSVWA